MSLKRNEFLSSGSLTTVFTSPSGLVDIRTGQPYNVGGLLVGDYFDLTEAEAQNQSPNLHEGRYRFVQIDSTANSANILRGTIGFVKSLSKGVNFITDASNALSINLRPVVFLAPLTATQVSAGSFVFVQEAGDATVLTKSGLSNGSPAVGDLCNATAAGTVDDPTSQNFVGATIGEFSQVPTGTQLVRCYLDIPAQAG